MHRQYSSDTECVSSNESVKVHHMDAQFPGQLERVGSGERVLSGLCALALVEDTVDLLCL